MKFIILFCLFCCVPTLSAQTQLQRRPHVASDYVLGPGDQFVLHVSDMDEISNKALTVDPNGFVDLPLAGRIEASGMSLLEFKADLKNRLSRYITDPEITINLTASESQPVSVVGQVNAPGVHQLSGTRRLIEVISMSGGLKPDAGPDVIVTRESQWGKIDAPHATYDAATGTSQVSISLDKLLNSNVPEDNIVIKPNDVVSVPRAELIYVLGDVRRPGGYQLSTHAKVSLLKILALSEGLGPNHAAGRARILRAVPDSNGVPKEIPVDINKIVAGKAPDVLLLANDVLYVPESGLKVTSRRAIDAAVGITSGIAIYRF